MASREYLANRPQFPLEELAKYRGQWVAFSFDGRRIVAGDEELGGLEKRLVALELDPQRVVFELRSRSRR